MRTRFMIGVLLVLTSLATLAAPRSFPPEARRGLMSAGADYTQVVIDGQVQHLAPGAKIKSKQNTIIMPSSLTNRVYVVNYTFDNQAMVDRVWILTEEERALSPQ